MSVQALGWVLDHSPASGADRLVLIAIANHAGTAPGESGAWEAWPGVQLICREAGFARERTVQDALARLVASGAVEREVNGAPDERVRRDHRPNLYRIRLDHGVTCGDTRCSWCGVTRGAGRGDAPRHDGVTPDDATGCRRASPEPSLEPSLNRAAQPAEPSPPAITADDRRTRLAAAAEIIGDRAAQRPGVQNPPAMRRAVAAGVVADRHAEAYAVIVAEPGISPADLAERLEPTEPAIPDPPRPRALPVDEVLSSEEPRWAEGVAALAVVREQVGFAQRPEADAGDEVCT